MSDYRMAKRSFNQKRPFRQQNLAAYAPPPNLHEQSATNRSFTLNSSTRALTVRTHRQKRSDSPSRMVRKYSQVIYKRLSFCAKDRFTTLQKL